MREGVRINPAGVLWAGLLLATAIHPVAAGGEALLDAYKALSSAEGKAYQTARDNFLKMPGAEAFLAEKVKNDGPDWLAQALHVTFKNPRLAKVCRDGQGTVQDKFSRTDTPDNFDALVWEPLNDLFYRYPAHLSPTPDVAAFFNQTDQQALILEWLIRNPNELTPGARFWLLKAETAVPFTDKEQHLLLKFAQKESIEKLKFDPPLMQKWFERALSEEADPIVKLWIAGRLPGEQSASILKELAKSDSALGGWAALLFAGRTRRLHLSSRDFEIGHPFNPEWLDNWAATMTPGQKGLIQDYFARKYVRPEHKAMPVSEPNRQLVIPPLVAGIFLRHHENAMSPAFKAAYQETVSDCVDNFVYYANIFKKDGDDGEFARSNLRELEASCALWPKDSEARVKDVSNADPEIQKMLSRVAEKIRKSELHYPSGEELSAIYAEAQGPKAP